MATESTAHHPEVRERPLTLDEHLTVMISKILTGLASHAAPGVVNGTLVFNITNPRGEEIDFRLLYFPSEDDDSHVTVAWGRYNRSDASGFITFAPQPDSQVTPEEYQKITSWLELLFELMEWRVLVSPDPCQPS